MTFAEYFSYYLTAPENQKPLTYLYSDRQYMLLLSSCSANKVSDMDISGQGPQVPVQTRGTGRPTAAWT